MIFICWCGEILARYSILLTPSLVPSPSFFRAQGGVRRGSRGEEKRKAWYPAIAHASVFSEFGYFSGHFSIIIYKRKRHHNRRG